MEDEPLLLRSRKRRGDDGDVFDDAESVRRTALVYTVSSSYIFGSFLALREAYTTNVIRASDPVAIGTYAIVCYYLGHAIASPFLGKLSDGTGRKPILLFSVASTCAVYLALALFPNCLGFLVLFGALGLCDSGYTMIYLMLVDSSNEPLSPGIMGWAARAAGVDEGGDDRSSEDDASLPVERRVGVLFSFCWGFGLLGSVLGVACSLFFVGLVGVRGTVAFDAGLAALLFVRVLFWLPETVPSNVDDGESKYFFDLVAESLEEQAAGFRVLFVESSRRRWLLFVSFLQHASAAGSFSLLVYWTVFKFGFGLALQVVGILIAIAAVAFGVLSLQLGLVPFFVGEQQTGSSKRPAELACVTLVLASIPFWTVLGLAYLPWMALVGSFAVASASIFPELRALITSDLPTSLQGFVQGSLATVNSLADIAGACVGIFLYEKAVDDDIPHDSHRSRMSVQANAVWHLTLLIQIVVASLIYVIPQEGSASGPRKKLIADTIYLTESSPSKAATHPIIVDSDDPNEQSI